MGRNDDYMPDFSARLRASIAWNVRYLVDEVVFVEWNPPADRELLSLALSREFPQVRAYVVDRQLHGELCENSNLALLEYHAKNVGIRRATGEWVIATNADVAIGPDTVVKVQRHIERGFALTATRVDIPWAVGRTAPPSLMDCIRYGRPIEPTEWGTGDFLMAERAAWNAARGYDEALVRHRIGCDVRGAAQLATHGFRLARAGTVLHFAHGTSCTTEFAPHHGEWADRSGLPYRNPETWGLAGRHEEPVAERVWRIG